jgi:catechol 2,3-dioxygenase-like lactoylglutathione lyase family enzyme
MIKGINHVAMSVYSLERSMHFYRDTLGMVVVAEGAFSGKDFEAILGLKNVRGRAALLKAERLQVELFQFETPQPRPSAPDRPVCDHGITHFCIEVADVDAAYDRLLRAGVRFHTSPITFFGTTRATYGRDPDGNVFELMQCPENDALSERVTV